MTIISVFYSQRNKTYVNIFAYLWMFKLIKSIITGSNTANFFMVY